MIQLKGYYQLSQGQKKGGKRKAQSRNATKDPTNILCTLRHSCFVFLCPPNEWHFMCLLKKSATVYSE